MYVLNWIMPQRVYMIPAKSSRHDEQKLLVSRQCHVLRKLLMFKKTAKFVVFIWNFVFDHESSPLRNLPDVATRHYVLQILGLMWAAAFSFEIGSIAFFSASVIGHTVLIAAAAITVATWTAAAKKPRLFNGLGRARGGEHD